MPNTKSEIRGCIDLGSSYFRLLVVLCPFPGGDTSPPAPEGAGRADAPVPAISVPCGIVAEERVYVGWGAEISGSGLLPDTSIARAAGALRLLVSRAAAARCTAPLLLGTNTLRAARNGEAALHLLREAAGGMPITVLTQRQEASLSYRGACTVLERPERSIVIDLGGTSTEVAWGNGTVMEDYWGIPWGTHAARELSLRAGPRRSLLMLTGLLSERIAAERIGRHYILPTAWEIPTICATGGTAVSLAAVVRFMRGEEPVALERTWVSARDLCLAARRVGALFAAGHGRRLPLEQERRELLVPGLTLLAALARAMDIDRFVVTPRDLRWGGIMSGERFAGPKSDGGRNR